MLPPLLFNAQHRLNIRYFTPGQKQTLAWQAEGVDEVRV